MIGALEFMNKYRNRNSKKYPDASNRLFSEIELTVEYLIQLGDQHKLNMNEILNHKSKNGSTLFFIAASFSEKLARMLMQRNVKVNIVDQKFMIPHFRVSKRLIFFYEF